jgi:hypothetical protein
MGTPPGEYRLLVKATFRTQEAAYLDVTVGEEDVSLNVRTNVGATVSGRVLIDGQPAATAANATIGNVSVAARPPPRQFGYGYAEMQVATLRGTDRFELRGLRGPTMLTSEVARGAPLSIRRAGEEIAGKTLELLGTETVDDVIVELTTRIAAVEVTLTGTGRPEEPEPVVVVLFAEDPSLWRIGHVQYATTYAPRESREGESETITLSRMPAGRYLVAALHDPGESDFSAAPVLDTLRKQATLQNSPFA